MNFQELEHRVVQMLTDGHLDKNEKRELSAIAANISDEQRRFVQNTVFDLLREHISAKELSSDNVLGGIRWLEKTLKALNPPGFVQAPSSAYFSPGTACLNKIVSLCESAKSHVDICVFTVSDNRITAAIIAAKDRGVNVRLLSDNDKSEDKGSDIDFMIERGVAVKMDASRHHMHHKFAIIDKATLINGSFNWTRSASERNQENILVTTERSLLQSYQACFDQLWEKYQLSH